VHFILHLAGATTKDLEHRAKVAGVADLFGGHDVLAMAEGPQGVAGINAGWLSPDNQRMHYEPSAQIWKPSFLQIDGQPAFWVGFWKDSLPKENQLRRVLTQPGSLIQLGEQKWKLPTPDTVDAEAIYRADGTMFWEPVSRFAWMVDEAAQLREAYLQESGVRMFVFKADPTPQIDWLTKLLRVNYRITPEVAAHLHLWIGKDHILDVFLNSLGLVRKTEVSNG
jgi:hypothetical protein